VEQILSSLRRRKNVILQGPPGVGKSFLARRLAYALVGAEAPDNVQMVQFHQSYAYEDFIQGWRPNGEGGFVLRNGVFYEFCLHAQARLGEPHVFVIDEINRGNLSKVFGELLLLIEADKRGPAFRIPLTYAESSTDTFYIPDNVFVIGLMNTADRSLAMVDYALRRRFAFHTLVPAFDSPAFAKTLSERGVNEETIARIRKQLAAVNAEIVGDHKNLGPGFAIGHSYFCPTANVEEPSAWYTSVVREELEPLLAEYWFDDEQRVERCRRLLEG
jgi:5-methylcytosine-specific restriction protein B